MPYKVWVNALCIAAFLSMLGKSKVSASCYYWGSHRQVYTDKHNSHNSVRIKSTLLTLKLEIRVPPWVLKTSTVQGRGDGQVKIPQSFSIIFSSFCLLDGYTLLTFSEFWQCFYRFCLGILAFLWRGRVGSLNSLFHNFCWCPSLVSSHFFKAHSKSFVSFRYSLVIIWTLACFLLQQNKSGLICHLFPTLEPAVSQNWFLLMEYGF